MYLCPIIDRSFCKSILFIYFLQEFNKKCSATTISRNKRRCLNCNRSAFNPHTFCTKTASHPHPAHIHRKRSDLQNPTFCKNHFSSLQEWPMTNCREQNGPGPLPLIQRSDSRMKRDFDLVLQIRIFTVTDYIERVIYQRSNPPDGILRDCPINYMGCARRRIRCNYLCNSTQFTGIGGEIVGNIIRITFITHLKTIFGMNGGFVSE